MGSKNRRVSEPPTPEAPAKDSVSQLTWCLADPGMDLLERAGLAGLYMALQAATRAGVDLSPLEWTESDLKPDSVTVRWKGPAKPAFVKLMQWAWQLKDGLFFFPAIHQDDGKWWYREPMHNGLMKTYFQNPNVQPALEATVKVVQIEEDKSIQVRFKVPGIRIDDTERGINPKTKRLHKKTVPSACVYPHRITDDELFDTKGEWKKRPLDLSNWIYPGIAGRYSNEDSWSGMANRALLLMLVPTICLFQRLHGEGGNWCLIVPDIRDMETYSSTRRRMTLDANFTDVASLGDAGLQFLSEYSSRDVRKKTLAGCRVVAMGNVSYYQNQSIRKAVLDVSDKRNCVKRYRILHQVFPNRFQRINRDPAPEAVKPTATPKKAKKAAAPKAATNTDEPQSNGWYKIPTGRGRIADNLVNGRAWYENYFVPMAWDEKELEYGRKQSENGFSTERVWFDTLATQWRQLMRLIQEDNMWDSEAEQLFVKSFWETLDSLYWQEADAVKRGGSRNVNDRWDDMNSDIRRQLLQAKTRVLLRGVIAALLAKAGRTTILGTYLAPIWRLIDDPNLWQKGRDLALLALASHRKSETRERNEANSTTQQETNS